MLSRLFMASLTARLDEASSENWLQYYMELQKDGTKLLASSHVASELTGHCKVALFSSGASTNILSP